MKWCERIAPSFNMTDPASGSIVFQEAVDCFCASVPSETLRTKLAEDIGAHLNISNEKVFVSSYFFLRIWYEYIIFHVQIANRVE